MTGELGRVRVVVKFSRNACDIDLLEIVLVAERFSD